jgi:GNAT superfamily N-acetyltransferase
MRPYRTLSTGEAFRATCARALAESGGLAVIDEFTSVVDRQVARVASHTIQKAVRRAKQQMIAVTCHYDVEEWLQPDWMYDVAASEFTWRSVQSHPPVEFEVRKCDRALWGMFARHHYLSSKLHPASHCFAAYVDGRPVAFTSYLNFPHPKTRNIKMGHRLVVLPDWQGLGLAGRLDDWLGQHLYEQGYRYRNTVAHPAMIRYYLRSPRWQETSGVGKRKTLHTSTTHKGLRERALNPRALGTRSFQYVPPKKA